MLSCKKINWDSFEEWESQWVGCFIGVRLKTQGLFIVDFQEETSKTIFPVLISTYNKTMMEFYSAKRKEKCRIGVSNYHYNGQTRYKLLWIM